MLNNLCLLPSARSSSCSMVCIISSRFCSQNIRPINPQDMASLKKGTGGRSSFNGKVVTVFGATGFLGRHICNQLGKRGSQLIIPYRCDSDDTALKTLKIAGDLGQVLFQPFDLQDPLSIRKALKYSNMAINLIGCHWETKNYDMYAVNVKGAREIAKACREMNIEKFIHFSSMNVTMNPEKKFLIKSKFFSTKFQGENAVLEEFPQATIFRPGSVCGAGDKFLWPLMTRNRRFIQLPLYAKGRKTTKIPIYGRDVAAAVIAALDTEDSKGKIYQLIGPETYYLGDIAYFCMQLTQRNGSYDDLISDIKLSPLSVAKILFNNHVMEILVAKPRYSLNLNLIEMESTSDVVDKNLPTTIDLGIAPQKFEDYVPYLIAKRFSAVSAHQIQEDAMINPDSLSAKALNNFRF